MNPLLADLAPPHQALLRPADPGGWMPPMLATLSEALPAGAQWLFEPKLDGVRCLAHVGAAGVTLRSRNRNDITGGYPEVASALARQVKADAVLDGELVVLRGGRTSFEAIQERLHVRAPSVELVRRVPVLYYVFDLLQLDGTDLRALPLLVRKALLRVAVRYRRPLRFTAHRLRGAQAVLEAACGRGEEGIIAKVATGRYLPRRSPEWLKVKCVRSEEFVIGGFTPPSGSREALGALLVGQYQEGVLRYAGKVGTGFDVPTLRGLLARLEALETPRAPFTPAPPEPGVRWVRPQLVAQVGYGERTTRGILRHPRFLGLRCDKPARSVVPEVPLAPAGALRPPGRGRWRSRARARR